MLEGYVPNDIIQCIEGFLDFCYLAQQYSHTEETLQKMQEALDRPHQYWDVFVETDVCLNRFVHTSILSNTTLTAFNSSVPLMGFALPLLSWSTFKLSKNLIDNPILTKHWIRSFWSINKWRRLRQLIATSHITTFHFFLSTLASPSRTLLLVSKPLMVKMRMFLLLMN